ncbi:MAG TPA: efflux RND transporter periplasmic adaptor subunit [Bryobacteraceae bacterium]|jgi:multidrug efflux system membrane fusion protein
MVGAGFLFSKRPDPPKPNAKSANNAAAAEGVPVSVAVARRGNLSVYISAIGTVTPVYTVTVTSRVAGEVMEVYYKEGQIVMKGDPLVLIDPRPYEATYVQAQGQLARDQALLANARIDLQRYKLALAQHAVPEQTYATQQATVAQYEGTVTLDQGNLAAAKVNLDYTRIVAPITGRVGLRSVDPGNNVQAIGATGLVTIAQLQPITVIFTMAENYISDVEHEVRLGHPLRVDALDREDQHLLATGTLITLDNLVDTATGTVRGRARFANEHNQLFPNEFVNARLLVKTLHGATIIPTATIQRNGQQAFVFVVHTPAMTAELRNIQVVDITGEQAAVTGVNPGDTLVTDGFARLVNGAKVSIRPGTASTAAPASHPANQGPNPAGSRHRARRASGNHAP